jgi:hypothetical protein
LYTRALSYSISVDVWILEVEDLVMNGGTGPRAVLCLAVSPGMDTTMRICYLIISLSYSCHACSSFRQFNLASLASRMSHVGAALMGEAEVFRCGAQSTTLAIPWIVVSHHKPTLWISNHREGILHIRASPHDRRPRYLYPSYFYVVPSTKQNT